MNLDNLTAHQVFLILLGVGTASVIMSMPIRLAQEVVSSLWDSMIGKNKTQEEGPNGFHARLEAMESWVERTQKLFDQGHFMTSKECDLVHDRMRREMKSND